MWHEYAISTLVVISVLSTLAAGFTPPPPARAVSTGWRALSAVLPAYTTLDSVAISPDSQYVVFRADIDVVDHYDLYSVPVTGTTPVRLNPPLVAGGSVSNFMITPDSNDVIYMADQEVDQRTELYSVPIAGGSAIKLNGPLASGGNVSSFRIDAGAGRVVYRADQQSNDVFELYSVPLGGGAFVRLNLPLTPGGNVIAYDIDPVSQRVVYNADQDTNDLYELYSVYLLGGPVVKLNPPVSQGILDFRLAPGAAYVMFIAKVVGASATELYGIDTPGFAVAQKINQDLGPGENVLEFLISPLATQVVYIIGANNLGIYGNLWRTSLSGGAPELLTDVADPGYGVSGFDLAFTPDGARVVFTYQQNAGAPTKLQSARADGAPVDRVDLFVADTTDQLLYAIALSPDSQWVVFEENAPSMSAVTLRAVPTAGGGLVLFGTGSTPRISPDSQRVVYEYLPPDHDHGDLLSTQIFGGGQRNLTRMPSRDYAYDPHFSPNGQWIVFQAQLNDISGATGYQLRVSDGAEAPLVFYNYLPLLRK